MWGRLEGRGRGPAGGWFSWTGLPFPGSRLGLCARACGGLADIAWNGPGFRGQIFFGFCASILFRTGGRAHGRGRCGRLHCPESDRHRYPFCRCHLVFCRLTCHGYALVPLMSSFLTHRSRVLVLIAAVIALAVALAAFAMLSRRGTTEGVSLSPVAYDATTTWSGGTRFCWAANRHDVMLVTDQPSPLRQPSRGADPQFAEQPVDKSSVCALDLRRHIARPLRRRILWLITPVTRNARSDSQSILDSRTWLRPVCIPPHRAANCGGRRSANGRSVESLWPCRSTGVNASP